MDRAPFAGTLAYLYVGTDDLARDLEFYRDALGAELVWRFDAFATEVAAVRIGTYPPLVLLAEHRGAPSCLPIWAVDDFDGAVARLEASRFEHDGETVGTPDGPVHVLTDPSGNQLGLLRQDRPNALDAAFSDPDNPRAVR